jgi:DNA-directed RNA polymerase subunit beta
MLQEMLTVKSDDIHGRLRTYERIVKGQNLIKPGVPESFRVLIKELHGLGMDVEIKYSDGSFGELVMSDEEAGHRIASLRPDASVDREGEEPQFEPVEKPDIFASTPGRKKETSAVDTARGRKDDLFISKDEEVPESDEEGDDG